ncbi:MAG: Cu(I)-responsive transcriptional regulator [Geminicoccaceae bacterium]
MNIGEAARTSGLPAKTIRYYEDIGLISEARRTTGNYRAYTTSDVHTLPFIKRARSLGFSVERVEQLLGLWRDRDRSSAEVKRVALDHVAELQAKIAELEALRDTVKHLADHCDGDDRPDCPILRDLADPEESGWANGAGRANGARRGRAEVGEAGMEWD